jgi:hypothetical protein
MRVDNDLREVGDYMVVADVTSLLRKCTKNGLQSVLIPTFLSSSHSFTTQINHDQSLVRQPSSITSHPLITKTQTPQTSIKMKAFTIIVALLVTVAAARGLPRAEAEDSEAGLPKCSKTCIKEHWKVSGCSSKNDYDCLCK